MSQPAYVVVPQPEPVRAITAPALLRNFKPIEATVDGLPMPRKGLTSVTARTGGGKTSIVSALLAVAHCRGEMFAGREVTRGSVLVLAGENPDDYTMHLAATLQDHGLSAEDVATEAGFLLTVPGVFAIDYEMDRLRREVSGTQLVAVIVDTSAAFFSAEEENDNVAMRRHASMLRELTGLPGSPAVIVLCHPTKNATQDNLLPRGGGSLLAEVDANLTLWKDEATNVVTLHWAGKIRGPSFDPIRFELVPVQLEGFVDCRKKPIWSSIARHLKDERAQQLEDRVINDQDRLLAALRKFPDGSVRELAEECGWVSESGDALKSKTDRRLKTLEEMKLAEPDRKGKWRLTPKGQKDANALPF